MIILGELGNAPRDKLLVFVKIAALYVPSRGKEACVAYGFRNLLRVVAEVHLDSHSTSLNVNAAIQKRLDARGLTSADVEGVSVDIGAKHGIRRLQDIYVEALDVEFLQKTSF